MVKRYKGKRTIIFHHRAAFMWSAYLMDIDHILMSFLTEPETVEIVMDKVLESNMRIVQRAKFSNAKCIFGISMRETTPSIREICPYRTLIRGRNGSFYHDVSLRAIDASP